MKNIKNTFKNTFAIIGIAVTVILACSKAVDEVVAATTEPPIEVIVNDNMVVTDNSTSSSQESNIGKYQITQSNSLKNDLGQVVYTVTLLNTTNGKFVISDWIAVEDKYTEGVQTKYASKLD